MPIGVYKHKPNQGFQKGHGFLGTEETKKKIKLSSIGKHRKRLMSYNAGFKKGNTYGSLVIWTPEKRKKIGDILRLPKVRFICRNCNKESFIHHSSAKSKKFCSNACAKKHLSGKNHWNWNGGSSSLSDKIKFSSKYIEWRKKILDRDKYSCVLCRKSKEVSGKLQVDHYPITRAEIAKRYKLKTFENYMNCLKMWDINNGRTLCELCHKMTPTFGYKNVKRMNK